MASATPGAGPSPERLREIYDELQRRGAFEKNDRMREIGAELGRRLGGAAPPSEAAAPPMASAPRMTRGSRPGGGHVAEVEALGAELLSPTRPENVAAERRRQAREAASKPANLATSAPKQASVKPNLAGSERPAAPTAFAPSPHGRAGAALGISAATPTGELGPGQPVRPLRTPSMFDRTVVLLGKLGDAFRAGGAKLGTEIDKNPRLALTLLRGSGSLDIGDEAIRQGEAVVRSGKAGIAAGKDLTKNYPPALVTNAMGLKPGQPGYLGARVLDYALDFTYNPGDVLTGKGVGVAGKATAPVTRPLAKAVEGGKTQVALMKATRAREAAETTLGAAKAGGAGRAVRQKLGLELAAAKAAERQAAAQVSQLGRTGKVGAAVARTPPVKAAVGAELAAQAHLRQEATKLTQGWLSTVGHIKGALLSRPSTVVTNSVGPFVQAEQELRRAGVGLSEFLRRTRAAGGQVAQYRRTGQATGTVARLLEHAPGILDAPAVLGGAGPTRNPLLRIQGQADELAKVNLFAALEPKLGAAEAAKRVKTVLFDYSDLPALVRLADKYGLAMFGSFGYSAMKSFADAVVRRPDLVARFPRLREQLLREFPGSKEEFDELKSYQRGPFVYPTGRETFVDVGRFHPWGEPLGMLQEAGRLGAEGIATPRPPTERDFLGRTILSPLASAAATAARQEGAPPEEQLKTFIAEAIMRHFPAERDYQRLRSAWEGKSSGKRMLDEPQTKAVAAAQAVFGVSPMHAEVGWEKKKRLAPELRQRAMGVNTFLGQIRKSLRDGGLKNKFVARMEGLKNSDEAGRALRNSEKYFREELMATDARSGRGRERLRDAYLQMLAAGKRYQELYRAERERAKQKAP